MLRSAFDLFNRVMPASRLQHERRARVGHDEAVVVGEAGPLQAAHAPLAKFGQQIGDGLHRLGRGGRSLQGQPQQVHSGQTAGGVRLAGEDCLVANRHAVLIGPHLGPPHPIGAAEQHGVGLCAWGISIQVHFSGVPAGWSRRGCQSRCWPSLGSRSEFFANSTPSGLTIAIVSHMMSRNLSGCRTERNAP